MKILFVGVFEPPQSSQHPMLREFRALGHTVEIFDYRKTEKELRVFQKLEHQLQKHLTYFQKSRLPLSFKTLIFSLPGIKKMNTMLLQKVINNTYDLVFMAKAEKVNYTNIDKLNNYSKTWYFFMDSIANARKIRAEEYAARSTSASASRRNVVDFFTHAGAEAVFLTEGTDKEYCYPNENTKKIYDVVFVGTLRENRKAVVAYLKQNGIPVKTFGERAENPAVFGSELGNIYRQTKINLNLNSDPASTGFSSRVLQVMGTGSMLLSQYSSDLETLFKNKKELVCFSTLEECKELIEYYLEHDTEREQIAKRGYEKVSKQYMWEHIIKTIIDKVQHY